MICIHDKAGALKFHKLFHFVLQMQHSAISVFYNVCKGGKIQIPLMQNTACTLVYSPGSKMRGNELHVTSISHTMSYWKVCCSEEAITGNYSIVELGHPSKIIKHIFCPNRIEPN